MKNVLEYLRKAAESHPDKVAFSDDLGSVTFCELQDRAGRVGTALAQELGVRRSPIVVLVDRTVESVCAFLGVAASGNFYVPVDPTQPAQRLRTILDQVQPAAIVDASRDGGASAGKGDAALVAEPPLSDCGARVFAYAELAGREPDFKLLEQIQRSSLDADPLFAICTSGSTGVPKCVVKSHRSVLEFIPVFVRTFDFSEDERFANQAPFDFDVSAKDIYTTLYCAASTFIVPKKCFAAPKALARALDEQDITALIWAVSALCVVAGLNAFKHIKPHAIRKVMFSGEVMPIKHLNKWREYYPNALFVNLYGPTESTGNCMYYVVDRDFELNETLPLGKAFENVEVMVLDDNGKPVEQCGEGEIFIRGASVALGYYHDPERTAAAFVQNPLNDAYPDIVYRTGDIARLGSDGQLRFAARKDFQIKHMGHRIELEEIEMQLNSIQGIGRSSCAFDTAANKIVAFYEGSLEAADIMCAMREKLPKYMIPNRFEKLDALPVSKNGKIDRAALRELLETTR